MNQGDARWTRSIAVAITGASGAAYGLRLVECLVEADARVFLLVSSAGQVVLKMEAGLEAPSRPAAPGFCFDPRGIDDLIDFMVTRVLDHLSVPHRFGQRWGEPG